jgi:hypothetical protein
MSEKELKEIDKESVTRVLNELKDFFTLSMTEVETAEMIEMNQLNISLRFLKSTYLEKRLKGISDIKTMIEKIESALLYESKRKNIMQPDSRFNRGMQDHDMMSYKIVKGPKFVT